MSDIAAPPKNQAVLDRLRKRLETYRKHHDEAAPRYEQTVNGVNEEQKQQTAILQQRFVESKSKNKQKKGDKKSQQQQQDSSLNNAKTSHKRTTDGEHCATSGDGYEPPTKKLPNSSSGSPYHNHTHHSSTSPNKSRSNNSKLKFLPPEARVKNGLQQPPQQQQQPSQMSNNNSNNLMSPMSQHNPGLSQSLHHDQFKQESGYVDLDACAAALEKDAPDSIINSDTLNDLISEISEFSSTDFMKDFDFGDDELDKSDNAANNSLIIVGNLSSNSTNSHEHPPTAYPVTPITPTNLNSPLHSNHGAGGSHPQMKMEGGDMGHMGSLLGHGPSPAPATTASPLASQLTNTGGTPPYIFDGSSGSPANAGGSSSSKRGYNSPNTTNSSMSIDSPAAQTLKQMAEQHQHKAQQMAGPSGPGGNSFKNSASPARSPFNDYAGGHGGQQQQQFPPSSSSASTEFMGASSNVNSSASGQFPPRPPPIGVSPELNVKQEVYSPTTQTSFSPGFGLEGGGGGGNKRPNHNGGRMGQVLSPVNKSFNQGLGAESSLLAGQSFMTRPPPNSSNNPSNYPSFPNQGQQIPNTPPNQQQIGGRGSPSVPMDVKARLGQQQQQSQQGQYYYQNNNPGMDPSQSQFNPLGGGPGGGVGMQTNGPQTINFTQQHLRIGGPSNVNMAPRMNVPPVMNRMAGPGPLPPRGQIPPQQQNPSQQQHQQQLMMRQQQQQHQHMNQQQQMQPGMMNRFPGPGPNGPRGQNMQQQQQQMINSNQQMQRPMNPQLQQQMYANGGQQQLMGPGGQLMGQGMQQQHMRQNMQQSYSNGNHNMMGGPPQQQQGNMQMGGRGGGGDWGGNMDPNIPNPRQQQQFPPNMGRQGAPRPNMQMASYHSGMQQQMQSQQPGMMPNSYNQQGGGMLPQQMGSYPPQQQMQQISGFNQQNNNMKAQSSYPNSSQQQFMKPPNNGTGGGLMCPQQPHPQQQQQQQMFSNQGMNNKGMVGGGGMGNDINIDQMLNNMGEDPSGYGSGGEDLFHSLDSNSTYHLSSILDNL